MLEVLLEVATTNLGRQIRNLGQVLVLEPSLLQEAGTVRVEFSKFGRDTPALSPTQLLGV